MKKIIIILTIFFSTISAISAEEVKRIVVGSKDAKITIIAFESLTCSHCANFHKDVYPGLKKDYLDTGLAKIEFRHFPLDIAAFNAAKVSQCKNDGHFYQRVGIGAFEFLQLPPVQYRGRQFVTLGGQILQHICAGGIGTGLALFASGQRHLVEQNFTQLLG